MPRYCSLYGFVSRALLVCRKRSTGRLLPISFTVIVFVLYYSYLYCIAYTSYHHNVVNIILLYLTVSCPALIIQYTIWPPDTKSE